MNNIVKYVLNKEIVGPVLGVILSVIIIELLLPCFRYAKSEAKEKLNNFYNVAYAFVEIRRGFSSIDERGQAHNKNNCGWFHNFQVEFGNNMAAPLAGPVGNEAIFFDYISAKFAFIDDDLKDKFVEYFKCRVPDAVQKGTKCEDSKLIKLRKEIEELIDAQYKKYKKTYDAKLVIGKWIIL